MGKHTASARSHSRCGASTLFHRALVVEKILIVLQDGGHCLENDVAVRILDRHLQVEILDRDVIVAEFDGAPHRRNTGLLHVSAHVLLPGQIAAYRLHRRIDERDRII